LGRNAPESFGQEDLDRHNSVNESGFGRNVSKWVGKAEVLPSNVISCALVGKNKGHPAVFPVDLPLFLIKLLSPENGFVVDPFAGSGSTGVAALLSGRNGVLIDKNETYCQVSVERIQREANAELDLALEYKQASSYDHHNNGTVAQLRLLESEEVSGEK
jgi:DNA modification methylase